MSTARGQRRGHGRRRWAAGMVGSGGGAVRPQPWRDSRVALVAVALLTAALMVGHSSAPSARAATGQEDDGQPRWAPQAGGVDGAYELGDVAFADHRYGLAVGQHGTILATADGGTTWVARDAPAFSTVTKSAFKLVAVAFPDPRHAYALPDGGDFILASRDGGRHWQQRYICESSTPCHQDSADRIDMNGLTDLHFVAGEDCPAETPYCHGWAVGRGPCCPLESLVVTTDDGGQTWQPQSTGPGGLEEHVLGGQLNGVHFTDPKHGWAVGQAGRILATTDGGDTWIEQDSGGTAERILSDVWFTDSQHGWISGHDCPFPHAERPLGCVGVILATSDGGATWQAQDYPLVEVRAGCGRTPTMRFNDVVFTDARHGYITMGFVDGCGQVLSTNDGGETWTVTHLGRLELFGLDFATGPGCPDRACYGWAAGGLGDHQEGVVWATTDGGGDWQPQISTRAELHDISCPDRRHCHAVGVVGHVSRSGMIVGSTDGGATWSSEQLPAGIGTLTSISCTTARHCHAVSPFSDSILATFNGGRTWTVQDRPDASPRDVSCTSSERCHAVGSNGAILATTDGGETWTRQHACESSGQGGECTADSEDRIDATLEAVAFTDADHGRAVGRGGVILTTGDGGATWVPTHRNDDGGNWASLDLTDIACSDAEHCRAVGSSEVEGKPPIDGDKEANVLLTTVDGGTTWSPQYACTSTTPCSSDTNGRITRGLFGVACAGKTTCYAVGRGGTLLRSVGDSWVQTADVTTTSLLDVEVVGGETPRVWATSHLADIYSTYHPAGPVEDLAAKVVDGRTAELSWQAPGQDGAGIPAEAATDFEVRVSDQPITLDNLGQARLACQHCGTPTPVQVGDAVSATVEDLEPGVEAFFAVRVIDEAGDPGPVATASLVLPDGVAPGRVTDLAASATSLNSVELSWSAPASNGDSGPPVRQFQVVQSRQPITGSSFDDAEQLCPQEGCQLPAPEEVGDELTLAVEDLAAETTYHYALKGVDAAGNVGPMSNVASVTTAADAVPPGQVTDLVATALSPSTVELAWSAPGSDGQAGPPAGRFVIKQSRRRLESEEAFTQAPAFCNGECVFDPQAVGDTLTLTVANLEVATTYHYALRAVDEAGNAGPVSNTARATTPGVAGAQAVGRVAGPTRIDTAVAVSRRVFAEGAGGAVLARADEFADALAAAPLAAQAGGPVLLTGAGGLSPATGQELDRLGVDRVYLVGGVQALSQAVAEDLRARGLEVVRLAGPTRVETAVAVARELARLAGPAQTAVLARADGFADALAAGRLAAQAGGPVLLSGTDRLPQATEQALEELVAGQQIYLAGGRAAIGAGPQRQVEQAGFTTRRLAGPERYATAVAVAAEAARLGADLTPVLLASGADFPDALAAGPAAHALGGTVLLVAPDDLDNSAATRDYLARHAEAVGAGFVVGGPAAVSDRVADQIAATIGG